MEKTDSYLADLNERRFNAMLSDNRPSYDGASYDLLMYRWRLGLVDAALDVLMSIDIMKAFGDPADDILETVINKLHFVADHSLRMMEGENNGQGESDHN